jgi:hypothetical protein
MTVSRIETTPDIAERIRASENKIEDELRERHLSQVLFQRSVIDAIEDLSARGALIFLEEEFLKDKKGKSMQERFMLAFDPKYFGKVHVIELGMTEHPASDGEVDGLKQEFRDLLSWVRSKGFMLDEIPLEQSGRALSSRQALESGANSDLLIIGRNRPLVDSIVQVDDKKVDLKIAKRMVFALPSLTGALLKKMEDRGLPFLEQTLLKHGTGGIIPIRTAYYLSTSIIDELDEPVSETFYGR